MKRFPSHIPIRILSAQRLSVALTLAIGAAAVAQDSSLDESAFREGLRERGLTEWLARHLEDTAPADDVDAMLRRRERLLAEAGEQDLPAAERRDRLVGASEILHRLIVNHPDDPRRGGWSMALARDLLERRDPEAFDAVLLYHLPGRPRETAHRLSRQAVEVLAALREHIAERWRQLEQLTEAELDKLQQTGAMRRLERDDAESMYLLTWAQVYEALSAEQADPETFRDLHQRITETYRWTELPAEQNLTRCGALAMAAVTARKAGETREAMRHAQSIVHLARQFKTAEQLQRAKRVILLAVLEQIRAMPVDANREQRLQEAQQWQRTSQPDNLAAEMALLLLHREILAEQSPTYEAEGANWLTPAEALQPLEDYADTIEKRGRLYGLLAGALTEAPPKPEENAFGVQLLLGSAIAEAQSQQPQPSDAALELLAKSIETGEQVIRHAAIRTPADIRAELMYLLGEGQAVAGNLPSAVAHFADLVEFYPDNARARTAARRAAVLSQVVLREADDQNAEKARSLFIRSVTLLRKIDPDAKEIDQLQFALAVALEQNGRLDEAAEEYQRTAETQPQQALAALLGRVRCLRRAANAADNDTERLRLAQAALAAARQGHQLSTAEPPRTDTDRRAAAAMTLALAHMLNDPAVAKYAEALDTLKGFEVRFPGSGDKLGAVLHERIRALQQLDELGRASEVVEGFLETNPDAAGPVMATLLQAMRGEVLSAMERGEDERVSQLSRQAATLAERLERWADEHPGRMKASDLLTIRVWHGWALLHAGEAEAALAILKTCEPEEGSALWYEVRLTTAETRLATGEAEAALKMFSGILHRVPEHSAIWWRAFVGNLSAHARLGGNAESIRQSIRQQENLAPDLGGPRWRRALNNLLTQLDRAVE